MRTVRNSSTRDRDAIVESTEVFASRKRGRRFPDPAAGSRDTVRDMQRRRLRLSRRRLRTTETHIPESAPVNASATAPPAELPAKSGKPTQPPSSREAEESQPKSPQRIRVPEEVSRKLLISTVVPMYPALARQARIQGTVVLDADISKDGTVETLQVISGHPLLVQAALDAVKQWRYKSYVLNGKPVAVNTQIIVAFALGG